LFDGRADNKDNLSFQKGLSEMFMHLRVIAGSKRGTSVPLDQRSWEELSVPVEASYT